MKVFGQLEKAQLENTTADAASQPKGMITYRSDLNVAKVSDGATFKEIADTDTAQTLSNKTLATPVISAFATVGNLPVVGNPGTLAYVTDVASMFYDNGSSWEIVSSLAGPQLLKLTASSGNFVVPSGVTKLNVYTNFIRLNVVSAGKGGSHSTGITTNGITYAWGLNTSGQIGDNSVVPKSSPVAVTGARSFTAISNGGAFTVALDSDGNAWSWGANNLGQLGDNTLTAKSTPIAVVSSVFYKQISSGEAHTLALAKNDELWAWGSGGNGRLGNGSTTAEQTPASVVGGHSFVAVSAGAAHSLALKANGEVWAFGNNSDGQLGTNNTTAYSSPVPVVGGHSFVAVSAGYDFSLALKANGEVWSWGYGLHGRLGDGTIVSKSSPVPVVGGHSFIAISGGYAHSLALKTNGEVWSWGLNANGQLGDNSVTPKSSPVAVSSIYPFKSISAGGSAGGSFSLASTYSGRIASWGINANGQLGNNSTTARSEPVLVANSSLYFPVLGYSSFRLALNVTPGQSIPYVISSPAGPSGQFSYFGDMLIPENITEILVEYTF